MGADSTQTEADQDVVWRENDEVGDVGDLLGFDFGAAESTDRSGLRALINSAIVSQRRLPMLDVIFDRAARLMTTSLRQLTDDNVEAALDDVSTTRFADFLQAIAHPTVIGVARIGALDAYGLLVAESALVLSIIDVLLGGRRGAGGFDSDERGLTAIELGLAHRILSSLVDDVSRAFEPVIPGGWSLDRMETTPRFAAIAQDASVCALAKYRIRVESGAGRAMLLIPHAALEPARERLGQSFALDAGRTATAWNEDLSSGVCAVAIDIAAVIAERTLTLGQLSRLRVGDTFSFVRSPTAGAALRAGETMIGRARVGRSGEIVAVKLETPITGLTLGGEP